MIVPLTKGKHNVLIKYIDPYFVVGCYSLMFFILVLMANYIYRKKTR